jgi:hypothetical protein
MPEKPAALTGESITISYLADARAGHGRFSITNPGVTPLTASVRSVSFRAARRSLSLQEIGALDLETDQSLDPGGFTVGPGSTLRFLLSFPPIPYDPSWGGSAKLELRLAIDHTELTAESTLQFVRRIPLE